MNDLAAYVFLSFLPILFGAMLVFLAMFFQKLIRAVKDMTN